MTRDANLSPLHQWWLSKLEAGVLVNGEWPDILEKNVLYRNYTDTLNGTGVSRRPDKTAFWIALRKFTPQWTRFRKRLRGRPTWFTHVPRLDACRAAWDAEMQRRPRQQTLRGAIASGQVRAMPIGRQWLITLPGADLDRWQRRRSA